MNNILDQIIADKRVEVAQKKKFIHESFLRSRDEYKDECASLKASLLNTGSTGIIAEFKRKSPSKGWINREAEAYDVAADYEFYGAAGVSILTDEIYFGGTLDDLINGRIVLKGPILRKDFIIDDYQVSETKAWGADVMLLIAACLTREEVKRMSKKAKEAGLEVILEIHDEPELDYLCDTIDMVGINNRNLKTFEVNIEKSLVLAEKIPGDFLKIAESGIHSVETIKLFRQNGFRGFLIGEHFMKEQDPGLAFKTFMDSLNNPSLEED
jgi:indole-3-glycerol phosphate synthase